MKQADETGRGTFTTIAFGLFCLYFGLLFLQFPVHGSLPGNLDTWYYIAIFNDYLQIIKHHLNGTFYGTSLYPVRQAFLLGDPSFVPGGIFLAFKLFTNDNIIAYYLFLVFTYALNGSLAALVARCTGAGIAASIFTGLAFSSCGFLLGNMENQNAVFYGPGLAAIAFYLLYRNSMNYRNLAWCVFFLALQIYSGTYLFVFCLLIILLIWLFRLNTGNRRSEVFIHILCLLAVTLLIFPFLYMYVIHTPIRGAVNPIQLKEFSRNLCFTLNDLPRPSYNNLLYKAPGDIQIDWLSKMHACFPGFCLMILVIIALRKINRARVLFIAVFFSGMLLASGPAFGSADYHVNSPLLILYKYFNFSNFLRLPFRAYGISVLALALLAGAGMEVLLTTSRLKNAFITVSCVGIFLLENLSFPFQLYHSSQYMVPDKLYTDFFTRYSGKVILHLPSKLMDTDNRFYNPFGETAREHIYMTWKGYHNNNTVNGSNGYLPVSRLMFEKYCLGFGDTTLFKSMMTYQPVDFIAYCKNLQMKHENIPDYRNLENYHFLERVAEDSNLIIFKTRVPSGN